MNRIEQLLNLADCTEIYTYGSDRGDKQMLAVADQAHFRDLED